MEPKEKKTVFAVSAHPDDIEFTMAGTMLLLKDRGWDLHYMTVSNGSWGTATMTREREVKPDVVLCQSPSDYMEDHQNAVRLAVTAAFCRGMTNAPTEPPMPATFQDVAVYHAAPHGNRDAMRKLVRSERYVDVSSVIPRKRAALACHKSQKEWLDVSQGYDSYLDSMQEAAALTGKLSGKYEYAEGWRRHNSLGFSGEDYDPLGEALADVSWLDPEYQKWLDS